MARGGIVQFLKRLGFAGAATAAIATGVEAAELHLVSSPALRPAAKAIAAEFERKTGGKVAIDFINGPDAIKRFQAGDAIDVTLQSTLDIEDMTKAGALNADSARDLVASKVALAVGKGAAKPDISTDDALKKALGAAKSIAYSAGTSGGFFVSAMAKLGIADMVKAKAEGHVIRGPVGPVVARGEAEIGAQQYGELLPIEGIDIVGLLPEDISTSIIYRVAVGSKPADAMSAKALAEFIRTPEAGKILNDAGFSPIK